MSARNPTAAVSATHATAASPLSNRELVISRIISASRKRVFKAWTTRLPQWWGPHGMTTPACEMDLRPGGAFRTVMRAPDGTAYPTRAVFLEVVDDERIAVADAFDVGRLPSPEAFFTAITTSDAAAAGRTKFTARALHDTVANRVRHEKIGFHPGWARARTASRPW
jgi:uncharacterized protein YndB with AHSA1/START domain